VAQLGDAVVHQQHLAILRDRQLVQDGTLSCPTSRLLPLALPGAADHSSGCQSPLALPARWPCWPRATLQRASGPDEASAGFKKTERKFQEISLAG
jgi:hypothetical protein